MAFPMTPDQFVNALRAEGCRVVTVGQYRTHNRNHKGPWGPVHGTMLHHTAGGEDGAVSFCYNGTTALPGPLCQGVITKDGTVHVISTGRSNHAGGGDPNVLAAVKDERYGDSPPATHQHQGTAGAIDGNQYFYGFECVNFGNGRDPWPAVQIEAMVRASAAISRFYQWTEKSTIAHREWSDYKPDPAGPGMPSMPVLRERIKERLAHPASWNPGTTAPTDPQGPDTMAIKPNRQSLIRTEDTPLIPGTPETLYWTTEGQDDGQGHGEGGKTIANNVTYSTVVNLALTGLAAGERVEVFVLEENDMGEPSASGVPAEVYGKSGSGPIRVSVPLMGVATERMTIRLINHGASVVTLTEARAFSHFWPNA